MVRPSQSLMMALAGLVIFGAVVLSAPVLAQMIAPAVQAPQDASGLLRPPAASPPGLLVTPTSQPTATTPPPSGQPRETAKVAPIRRVIPKTPPLPTAVAKAIKASKAQPRKQSARAETVDRKPMALGARTTDTSKTCAPGQILVRKTGQCEKRSQAAAAKPKRK